VQLSGFVDSADQIKEASHVANGVVGVKSVRNNLIVRQRGSYSNPPRRQELKQLAAILLIAFGRSVITEQYR
jgi:hypothetical protein